MAITAIAALVVAASSQGEAAPVNLGADLRSYSEIAAALTAPGRHVVVAPDLANRIAVVSFRNRPWADARSLIEKGLDVAVRPVAEGEWRIEESPEIAARKAKLYSAFLVETDAHYAQIMGEYRRLSHGQYPPPIDRTKAMIEEQLRSTPPRQGASEGNRLFSASAPWPVIAALALMYGTASSDADDLKVSGPALYYVNKGNTIKRLVGGDLMNYGDAYFWRNWQDMPQYIRDLAVAQVRNYETELSNAKSLTPEQKQNLLAAYAKSVCIAHRLRFHPDRGSIFFEYSVLTDPGIDESVFDIPLENDKAKDITTKIALTFKVVEIRASEELLNARLNAEEANKWVGAVSLDFFESKSSGWYDQSRVRALALPMDEDFLKKVETRAGLPEEVSSRVDATAEALASEKGSASFDVKPGSESIGEALVDYANQTGTDVVAEVIPARDKRLGAGNSRRSLTDLMPWLADLKQDTQKRVKSWTLSFDKGAAIIRDEWAYLDDNYMLPALPVLKLGRAAIRPNGGGRGATYDDLVAYSRSVTPAENALAARFDPPFGVPVAARIYPFVNFIEKLAPKARQAFFATLVKEGKAVIPMKTMALQAKLALINELRKVDELNPDANPGGGALHHSMFHTQINNSVINGQLEVRATDMKNPERPLHMLYFTLSGPPLNRASNVYISKRFTIASTGTDVYREQFGPIQLPR